MLCDLQIFSGGVYHGTSSNLTHNLFSICTKFLVVIWFLLFIYLFSKGKHDGAVVHCIICLRFSSPCGAIWERRNKECDFFGNRKCELITNFSATMVTIWELQNEGFEFWARESVNSLPISVHVTKVTSLRSLSLSLSLHLTHNIPSAFTLGIIPDKGWHTRLGSVKCIYEINCIAENFRQECRFRQCYF